MLNKHEANATINLIYDEELHGDKRKVRRVTLQDPRRSSADIRERERESPREKSAEVCVRSNITTRSAVVWH